MAAEWSEIAQMTKGLHNDLLQMIGEAKAEIIAIQTVETVALVEIALLHPNPKAKIESIRQVLDARAAEIEAMGSPAGATLIRNVARFSCKVLGVADTE